MSSLAGARRIGRGLGIALALAALPASAAQAATGLRKLPTTSTALTIPSATAGSCLAHRTAGSRGTSLRSYTAKVDGALSVRLAGGSRDDWDLALFDTSSGRRIDASQAWGANEVVQAVVRKGQSLMIQACRLSGRSATVPLRISGVAAPLAAVGAATPKESLVSIRIAGPEDFTKLEATGLNLDEVPNGDKALAVVSGPADSAKITQAGFTYETLVPNLAQQERRYRARDNAAAAKAAPSELPSGRNGYRELTDIQADLKKIVAAHPNIAKPVTLPKKTFQGRDISGIEVTENVNAIDDGKPTFFLMGNHHAREWPSAEIPLEFGIYLTNGFGSDERITKLLKRVRIVIVPVINVDGYVASRGALDPADTTGQSLIATGESAAPPGGSLAYRRKNCHGASDDPATPCEAQYGIDPNRNYGQFWGGPGAGTDPNSQTYRGTDQWSEPETQAVHEYSQRHDVTSLVTMHNFASLVLRPPGLDSQGLAPDEPALKELGDKMADAAGYVSQFGYQLYNTTGTTEDWNYAAAGTFGYTIEMGPSADKGGNFHIEYARAVVNQWTGSETEKGKGKGLREALLLAGEAGGNAGEFATLTGTAPPDSLLRLHKNFDTPTSDPICAFETTAVSCPGGFEPGHKTKDFLDYTTRVPATGKFSWLVTPSTRPFELKAGRSEKWTLTCENPVSGKVLGRRTITVDRGQVLPVDLKCGAKTGPAPVPQGPACIDKRKFVLQAHTPRGGKLLRIVVYVNNKRALVLKGKKARRGRIVLNKLRPLRGRYKVTVVAYGTKGYRRISTRVYKGCKKGRPTTTQTHRGQK